MRAFQVTAQSAGAVVEISTPEPRLGEVLVRTALAGICGTDVGLYSGGAERLASARTSYPLQLGHEWCGEVVGLGEGVDRGWLGVRVTGDTMIGCGVCYLCASGRHHVCPDRFEIGVRRGWPGAFAEFLPVPVGGLHRLPDSVDDRLGAMVEPGGNAVRAVNAAAATGAESILIIGAGTIGLLAAQFAVARGLSPVVLARRAESVQLATSIGLTATEDAGTLASARWAAVIDCTDSETIPAMALDLVEPTGRVILMGVSKAPSLIDTRVALRKEATLVGILGASAGLDDAIAAYADGSVDPRPLIAETIGLRELDDELAGRRPRRDARPKITVDPLR